MNPSQISTSLPRRIPIVVAAMTRAELPPPIGALGDTDVVEERRLYDFLGLLAENDLEDVRQRYGDERTEWHPFGANKPTIRHLVEEFFDKFDQKHSLTPDFGLAEDFFDLDSTTSETTWIELRDREYCFLLVDGVSLYHSHIRGTLIHALSAVGEKATVVVLSPFDSTRTPVHGSLMELVEEHCKGVMARYRRDFDPRIDILAGGKLCFDRWLKTSIQRTRAEIKKQRMAPDKRAAMEGLQPILQGYSP